VKWSAELVALVPTGGDHGYVHRPGRAHRRGGSELGAERDGDVGGSGRAEVDGAGIAEVGPVMVTEVPEVKPAVGLTALTVGAPS